MTGRKRRPKREPQQRFAVDDEVVISDEYRELVKHPDGRPTRLEGLVGSVKEIAYFGGYEVDFGIPTPKYGKTPSHPTWLMRDEYLEPAPR
jgi:hypothetical protein